MLCKAKQDLKTGSKEITNCLRRMKTIIVDDEKPAIQLLSAFVKRIPFLHLELATTNAFEALAFMNTQQVDLLLLDIEMPDITGIELVKSLEKPPFIIFTTAYENYAVKGFELDIVDYLVKPIPFDRFLKGINKVQKLVNNQGQVSTPPTENFILIKSDYQTIKILHDDILYIEGLKDYVKIFTETEMMMTRLNLKGIQEKLPAKSFVRIHRSYIASLAKISAFQKSQLTIKQQQLPIGESYREELLQKLGGS